MYSKEEIGKSSPVVNQSFNYNHTTAFGTRKTSFCIFYCIVFFIYFFQKYLCTVHTLGEVLSKATYWLNIFSQFAHKSFTMAL